MGMILEFDSEGGIVNVSDGGAPGDANWYPDDTKLVNREPGKGPLVVAPPTLQARDWPERAAKQWDGEKWEDSGGEPAETLIEKAIRLLRENPLDDLPDVTVPTLPDNPTNAQVVDQVKKHTNHIQAMADEVVRHRKYVEGYRKLLLRVLRGIQRETIHRDDQ